MKKGPKLYLLIIVIATLFMGIGYASINSTVLEIIGGLAYSAPDDVFITQVQYESNVGANLDETEIINYFDTTLNTVVELSKTNPNSSVTFSVTVFNNTQHDYRFEGVKHSDSEMFYSNPDITYSLNGLYEDYILPSKKTITFTVTFKYKNNVLSNNNELLSFINFSFKRFYKVTYQNIDMDDSYPIYVNDKSDLNVLFKQDLSNFTVTMCDKKLHKTDYIYENRNLTVKNATCDITITDGTKNKYLSTYIKELYENDNHTKIVTEGNEEISRAVSKKLQKDSFGNIRYYGGSPNNNVSFNNENWFAVGVFEVEDGEDEPHTRVKLIRENDIGETDYKSGFDYSYGGANNFPTSSIRRILDSYYNRQSTKCSNFYGEMDCDYTTSGLKQEFYQYVASTKFHLGGLPVDEESLYPNVLYSRERQNSVYRCEGNETVDCPRDTYYVGNIALMHMSDYTYATDLDICRDPYQSIPECFENNYLYSYEYLDEWTITPIIDYGYQIYSIWHAFDGYLSPLATSAVGNIRPALYLNDDVFYKGGTGTKTDQLQIYYIDKYNVTYENISNTSSYPSTVFKGDNLIINFDNDIPFELEVYQNGTLLTYGYTYTNGSLKITNVNGDIKVVAPAKKEIHVSSRAELLVALNNLNSSDRNTTIILDKDIPLTNSITIQNAKNVTIDFNEHSISTKSLIKGTYLIYIRSGDNVVLKNTGGNEITSNYGGILVESSFTGNVLLDGISITTTDEVGIRSLSQTARIKVNRCNITCKNWAGINNAAGSTMNLYDNVIKGKNYALNNSSSGIVNVYSGTYIGGTALNAINKFNIYGGRYNTQVAPAAGYKMEIDSNGMYVVTK